MIIWKVLKLEYLIKRPWLTARQDKVELPDGRIIDDYYVLVYPDWVNIIAIIEAGEFVMEKQYRYGLGILNTELSYGVMEPLETAQWELLEETGYGKGRWNHWMLIAPNPEFSNNLTHCFVAVDVEKMVAPSLDATEDLTVHLITTDEVKTLLNNEQICQALKVTPLYKFFLQINLCRNRNGWRNLLDTEKSPAL